MSAPIYINSDRTFVCVGKERSLFCELYQALKRLYKAITPNRSLYCS
ncbi:hypothetical protein [Nostoc sp. UHCC 0251]|nr:hypothetical protein [Nostoc sp. UHCC 0251]MEA5625286.1 hypothetical protein [Nostoc sp. UHCC 0251]